MDLHGQIMNLPTPSGTGFAPGTSGDYGYRMGHRDACHAAAELALKAACDEIESMRKDARGKFSAEMIEAIYAAWHGAGVDIAGGNWARFVGVLPLT